MREERVARRGGISESVCSLVLIKRATTYIEYTIIDWNIYIHINNKKACCTAVYDILHSQLRNQSRLTDPFVPLERGPCLTRDGCVSLLLLGSFPLRSFLAS